MAGILTDVGVIKDGKVTDQAYNGYLKDVMKMLKTGQGIFPPGVACTRAVKPNPFSESQNLLDYKTFESFHKIWRPRYENMIKTLDVPGDFQLAKNGLLPLIDPTAVAKLIGASPPPLDLPGALGMMLAGPPMGTQPFIALHFPDLALDVGKLAELLSPSSSFMKVLIPSIPVPPTPELPDPLELEFGLKSKFNFGMGLALAPVKTHAKMMIPAFITAELPGIIAKLAKGDVLGGLIQPVCSMVGADHPNPSHSGSSVELAAQQILIQHQVKYQALGFIGQNVGSGIVTQSMATLSFENGGLAILTKEPEEVDEYPPLVLEPDHPIRFRAKNIIDGALNVRRVGNSVAGEAFHGGSGNFAAICPGYSQTIIDGQLWDWNSAWDYVNALQAVAGEKVPTAAPEKKKDTGVAPPGSAAELKQLQELNTSLVRQDQIALLTANMTKQQAVDRLAKLREESPIFRTMRGYTTCGAMPGFVYERLLIESIGRSRGPFYSARENRKKTTQKNEIPKYHITDRGLASFWNSSRGIEEKYGFKRDFVWRIADPMCGQTMRMIMDPNFCPGCGDAILYTFYTKCSRSNWNSPASASDTNYNDYPYYIVPNVGRAEVAHIGIMYDRIYEKGLEYWLCADAGQGGKNNQGAKIIKRLITRSPEDGILVSGEGTGTDVKNTSHLRVVNGWLDISKIPELLLPSERTALIGASMFKEKEKVIDQSFILQDYLPS